MPERDIFIGALKITDPAEQAAYLDKACAGDSELRQRVHVLLGVHGSAGNFLERPAAELLATVPEPIDATQAFDPSNDHKGPAMARTEGEGSGDDESDDLSFLQPATRPDSLGRIGHYEVLQVLGKGGFGTVFRAFDDVLHRVVAVKVMSPQLASTSPARKRFLREARSSAQVRHENVVQTYEIGEQPLPYIAMEFIPGETLQQRLDRVGPVDAAEVVRIGRQIAEGLAAAHSTDLIHRDIKPGNVLLEGGAQRVKITDFGLARAADDASLSQSGIIAGTPMYMAPEQAKGETLDQRADLFSLGSVLYQMVAGRPPFRATGTLAVLKRVAEDNPRPIREIIPETPQWLCAIIAKLHAKNPEDRYHSAREVADVLADCEAQLKANAKLKDFSRIPQSKQPAAGKSGRRMWAAAAVLLLPMIALAVTEFAGVTHLFRGQATHDPIKIAKGLTPIPDGTPSPAIPPFDAAKAKEHQDASAKLLAALGSVGEIRRFEGHTGAVISVAISADATRALSGSHDGTVRLWDTVTGKELLKLDAAAGWCEAVALSPDASHALAGYVDGSVRLWDLKLGKEVKRFEGHVGQIRGMAFSPDGKLALSGGSDRTARLWDVATGKELHRLIGHEGSLCSAAFSSDGKTALTGDSSYKDGKFDDTIKVSMRHWEVKTGKELGAYVGHPGAVIGVTFLPDGRRALSGGLGDKKGIRIWNLDDKKELGGFGADGHFVHGIALPSDGRSVVTVGSSDRTVRVWDVATGKQLHSFSGHDDTLYGVAVSADGRYALSGGGNTEKTQPSDNSVRLWRMPDPSAPVPAATATPVNDAWLKQVAAMPAEQQVDAVKAKLMDLNPGFDGAVKHKIDDGVVTELRIVTDKVTNISPIQVFSGLRVLDCSGTLTPDYRALGQLADLTPLKGMNLAGIVDLRLNWTKVGDVDLARFKDCKNLWFLELAGTKVSDAGLAYFKNCNNLEHLGLGSTQVSDEGLGHFRDCKNLIGLGLGSSVNVSDAGLAHFKDCIKLRTLYLHYTKVGDLGLAHFKDCKDLILLDVQQTKVTAAKIEELKKALPNCKIEWDGVDAAWVKQVAAMPAEQQIDAVKAKLKVLNPGFDGDIKHKIDDGVVTELRIVTDKVTNISPIQVFNSLRVINLSGTPDPSNWSLRNGQLADLTPLKGMNLAGIMELYLKDTKVTDAGLAHFENCKSLTVLDLAGTKASNSGLAYFKGCENLKWIILDATPVSDGGLAHFKDCKNLTILTLGGTKVSNAGLAYFKDCKSLEHLYLNHTSVSDIGLVHFKDCKNLTRILLGATKVGDAGLESFKDCKNLTHLLLEGTKVSDAGLDNFKDCKDLQFLDVRKTKVTSAKIAELKKELPGCKIEWDGAPAKADTQPFVVLDAKSKEERKFTTLADAVAETANGDTIEIRGDGPFKPAPMVLDKALTLRAGAGFRPVLVHATDGSLLMTTAPLVLEGLEIHSFGNKEKEWRNFVLWSKHSPLRLAHCRVLVTGPVMNLVAEDCPLLEIRHSQVLARDWGAFFWGPKGSGKLLVNNCLLSGVGVAHGKPPREAEIELTNNTFAREANVFGHRCNVDPTDVDKKADYRSVRVKATRNVFAYRHEFAAVEYADGARPFRPDALADWYREHIVWEADDNLFAGAGDFLVVRAGDFGVENTQRVCKTIKDWQTFWKADKASGIEGAARFSCGDLIDRVSKEMARLTPADFRLEKGSPGQGAGPGGKDLGADVDRVGPGPAYERWRKTPEYQEWRRQADEKQP